MNKITRLLATAALLFGVLGGVKATKTNWNPSGWVASWNGETKTMSWKGTDGYKVMSTNFPTGDLSAYTKIRATITSITGDNDYIELKVLSTDKSEQRIKLYEGVNNIYFSDYSSVINFEDVTELTLWGTGSSDGSAVITEMYLYNPVKTIQTFDSFGDEITDLSYLTGGGSFVIAKADGSALLTFKSSEAGASSTSLADLNESLYDYYTIEELPSLDVDEDGTPDATTYYRIAIHNAAGENKPSNWWGANFVDIVSWGDLWSTNCQSDLESKNDKDEIWLHYGRDGKFRAVWTVAYVEGSGFKFLNPKTSKYLKVAGTSDSETFVKLYKSFSFTSSTDLEKEDNAANDAIFALADATGYNAETGILKDGGWTFATPVDLSDWDYLVITVENTSRSTDTYIKITDNSGKYVQTMQYNPENASIGPQMYFGTYNNHNIACFSMDYLRINKDLDISNISSLELTGEGLKISSVYLTDYAHPSLATRGRWNYYVAGDVVRSYDSEGVGKFGTICLPYVASCAGAEVYSIEGKVGNSLTLNKVTGLLEAGKPYFYKASDVTGKDADVHNVNFFRADLAKFDAASAGSANGLVGTFSAITAPQDSYVLSNNRLYKVDSDVNVGANKAYVDLDDVPASLSRGSIFIDFDETTGIKTVKSSESIFNGSEFFDLQGRRVAQPVKGMYIVNGKKVMVK